MSDVPLQRVWSTRSVETEGSDGLAWASFPNLATPESHQIKVIQTRDSNQAETNMGFKIKLNQTWGSQPAPHFQTWPLCQIQFEVGRGFILHRPTEEMPNQRS